MVFVGADNANVSDPTVASVGYPGLVILTISFPLALFFAFLALGLYVFLSVICLVWDFPGISGVVAVNASSINGANLGTRCLSTNPTGICLSDNELTKLTNGSNWLTGLPASCPATYGIIWSSFPPLLHSFVARKVVIVGYPSRSVAGVVAQRGCFCVS